MGTESQEVSLLLSGRLQEVPGVLKQFGIAVPAPVHGELPICAHFLHFLESLLGRCHAGFGKSEEGPRDRFGVSVGAHLETLDGEIV